MPTRKWWAATVTGIAGVLVMLLTGESEVTDPEKVAIVTLVAQRFVAWITRNEKTPSGDGVPA